MEENHNKKVVEEEEEEEEMLPGFRFHPTDEELVGFYLRRKVEHRSLAIQLIKQVDIYKYDPWDLPKVATITGEKEWYFYCPRDRKYRNSARPNRVTGAGFWKATGTDRPIYSSSEGGSSNKCIGLKKSLVFYRGRAAKGLKTDWMMHEFRLPPLLPTHQHSPPTTTKKLLLLDKSLPPNEAWAICRIFKKTSSMAQRGISHPWMSPLPPNSIIPSSDFFNNNNNNNNNSCTSQLGLVFQQQPPNLSPSSYRPPTFPFPSTNFIFPAVESSIPPCRSTTSSSIKDSSEVLELSGFSMHQQQQHLDLDLDLDLDDDEGGGGGGGGGLSLRKNNNINVNVNNNQWVVGNGMMRSSSSSSSIGFPFSLQPNLGGADAAAASWDPALQHPPPSPTDMPSTCYSTNKCYT